MSKEKITRSDEEWRARLPAPVYDVTRAGGTEPPFSGALCNEKRNGVYLCACCNSTLFSSEAKFDSGTGWPSFFQATDSDAVSNHQDHSHGMRRVEARCAACDAHLGHVFPDGPAPTGLRYCINSLSLAFRPLKEGESEAQNEARGGEVESGESPPLKWKMALDIAPAAVFFAAWLLGGLYVATAALMAAMAAVLLAWKFVLRRPPEKAVKITAALVFIFGGLTLLLQDRAFIQLKTTVLYAGFSAAVLISHFAMKRGLIRALFEKALELPDALWDRLTLLWGGFFGALALINYVVAERFSEAVWVNTKTFVFPAATMLFIIAQFGALHRYVRGR